MRRYQWQCLIRGKREATRRLNEAQRDLIVAQAQLALARVALRFSWYDLQTATGQILETFK